MANMGFNPANHAMSMGGVSMQSTPFMNSGGAYSNQGMPLHASAHMAPPQAYAAQVRDATPMSDAASLQYRTEQHNVIVCFSLSLWSHVAIM